MSNFTRTTPAIMALGMVLFAMSPNAAHAEGCIKGAVVGGVAGHVLGHHGGMGAAAGCAVGHHEATKADKTNAAHPTASPAPSPGKPQ